MDESWLGSGIWCPGDQVQGMLAPKGDVDVSKGFVFVGMFGFVIVYVFFGECRNCRCEMNLRGYTHFDMYLR